jgi:hypothetical protein
MTGPPGTSSPIAGAPGGVRREAAPLWRALLYRAPTPERGATPDRWLRANPGAWVRLDHGTDAALPVAHEGLKPTGGVRRNSLQSRPGYVSFSIYPGHAEVFARMAFPRRAVTVYGVDLRVGEWVADRDPLRSQRTWARREVKDTLTHSLAFGHGAQVKGGVAAERLFIVKQCLSAEQMSAEMLPRVVPRAPRPAAGMRL